MNWWDRCLLSVAISISQRPKMRDNDRGVHQFESSVPGHELAVGRDAGERLCNPTRAAWQISRLQVEWSVSIE
jgi:hypothetical protein